MRADNYEILRRNLIINDNNQLQNCGIEDCPLNDIVKEIKKFNILEIDLKSAYDITISDNSVYTVTGIKRDYFGYKFDDEEIANGNVLKHPIGRKIVKKWSFDYKESEIETSIETEFKYPNSTYPKLDCKILNQYVKDKKFIVEAEITIPNLPGFYKKFIEFYINGKKQGGKDGKSWIIIRVVPNKVLSPVKGKVGPIEIQGRYAANYQFTETYYFCNWGLKYWDRNAEYLLNANKNELKYFENGEEKYYETHRWGDYWAFDVNGKSDFEILENHNRVYAIDDGVVAFEGHGYGAEGGRKLLLRHGKMDGFLGYYSLYQHITIESGISKDTLVTKGQQIGLINAGDKHLHFAIYPLKEGFTSGDPYNRLESVHVFIDENPRDDN